VEERILELQERKRAVVANALDRGRNATGGEAARLTMEDLHFLFADLMG
jgi:SNF2 family DNA or RNA helicase